MNITVDESYKPLATEFQSEQVRMLKAMLEKFGVTGDIAKEICGEFTFHLAVYFDQGEIEHEGVSYRPSIVFTDDEDKFIGQPLDVEFHEYAFRTTADIFESKA